MKYTLLILSLVALAASGCAWPYHHSDHTCKTYGGPPYGPAHDRPFPVGQVSDSHWETQQTNAEAADFIFYDHEFRYDTTKHVETAQLSPRAKKKLEQVALRLEHVPFPVIIEELPRTHDEAKNHEKGLLEEARRKTVVEQLNRLGVTNADERVVLSNAFPEGFTGVEGERSYFNVINGAFGGGAGRRFGGTGGAYR